MNNVRIELCVPQQPVRIINAKLSTAISEFQRLWSTSPKYLVFRDSVLLETLTLTFVGIRNGDSIIASPHTMTSQIGMVQTWESVRRGAEEFDD
jgi:hypothetical protein